MIPIEDPEEILAMDTGKLWSVIEIMKATNEISPSDLEILKTIEKGFSLRIPLLYIMEGWYIPMPDYKIVQIKGYGKKPIQLFYDEKHKRDRIMREVILRNLKDDTPVEGRNL